MNNCAHCGESLEGEASAEIYADSHDARDITRLGMESILVHAEPCAEELLRHGWAVA